MTQKEIVYMVKRNIVRFCLLLVFAATLGMRFARADLIVSAPAFTVGPGEASAFDVLLTNTGTTSVRVGGFSFEIADPVIFFEGATMQTITAPYIYAGDSFVTINGLPFATSIGTTLIASDTPNDGVAPSLLPGATVSLGRVIVDPTFESGIYTIAFQIPPTGLADQSGNPLPFATVNGTIEVAPEPSYLLVVLMSLGAIAFVTDNRERKRCIVADGKISPKRSKG